MSRDLLARYMAARRRLAKARAAAAPARETIVAHADDDNPVPVTGRVLEWRGEGDLCLVEWQLPEGGTATREEHTDQLTPVRRP